MKKLVIRHLSLVAALAALATSADPATNAPADSLIREIALRESSKNVKLHEHVLDCFTAGTNALAKGFDGIALAKFEEMERVASLVNGLPAVENLADIREQARKLAEEIRQTADPRHRLSGTVSKIVPNATNDDFEDGDNIVSEWQPNTNYQSWLDTLHGGIQATLLDELCGWVVSRKLQTAGVTSKMETRYRKPVLISKGKIIISGHIREQRRNIVIIDAQIADSEGVVCTEATCTYFTMPREKAQAEMNFRECKLEGE